MNSRAETPPAEVQAALPGAVLVGSTRLRIWGFAVYDAALWAEPGFRPAAYASQAFALELRYLRDFTRADIARRSIEEMRRSAPIEEARSQQWQQALRAAFPDVQAGDRITGIHRPGSAAFVTNGRATGEIRDGDFAALFFGIWLSPKTSEPAMRQALIGGAVP